MSEDFVDVTWRGLEVVKKARLRGTGAHSAYLEHATPMPTGSRLTIRTADGLELAATVARVQEQIGGRTEPPGMEVAIEAAGAAATWWLARAEAAVASAHAVADAARVRASSRDTMAMTAVSMPDLVPPPIPEPEPVPVQAPTPVPVQAPVPVLAVTPVETGPTRPSARASAVTMPPPMQLPPTEPPPMIEEVRRTDLMFSVRALEAAEAAEDNGDAIPTGIDDSVDRPGDEIVDDGRRTMIMPAIDIQAIVDAANKPDGDDDGNGGTTAEKKKAKGKRRRGR